jgi:hypothetical protein
MENQYPAVDPELLAMLPPILRAVVKALGYIRAREWLGEYGGVNVSIPSKKERALNLEADELDRLRATLAPHIDANGRVTMPKADKLLAMTRNASIRREANQQSISKQARTYGLSSRQITNIRREVEDENRQFDLF